MVGERGHPQAMAGGRLGVEAEQRVGVSVGGAGAAPDESGGGVQGAARQEQPRALAQRPLYAGLTTHQIERSPPMQPIAPGPAGAQVEDVGEPTIIARGRTAHVQHGAPHGGGVEAGQEPAQVEGRVDRRTVQQHQLEIGGGAAHEEHVARLGRIASPSFAPRARSTPASAIPVPSAKVLSATSLAAHAGAATRRSRGLTSGTVTPAARTVNSGISIGCRMSSRSTATELPEGTSTSTCPTSWPAWSARIRTRPGATPRRW